MKDLETKAVEILDKIEAIATNYAPDVSQAAIEAVRITAISELVFSLVGAVMVVLCFVLSKKLINFCVRKKEDEGYYSEWEIGYTLLYGTGVFGCGFGGLITVFSLLDTWMWITIFNPELGLAHKLSGL